MQEGAGENGAIYSDVSVTLQAVIRPAKSINIFKEIDMRLVPLSCLSLYHFLSFIASLTIYISITLPASFLFPPIESPHYFPFHICSLSLFCSLCPQFAAAVRRCQDQVALKSWQRQRCLVSLADTLLGAVKLWFKHPHLPPQWRDRGMDERRDAEKRCTHDALNYNLCVQERCVRIRKERNRKK